MMKNYAHFGKSLIPHGIKKMFKLVELNTSLSSTMKKLFWNHSKQLLLETIPTALKLHLEYLHNIFQKIINKIKKQFYYQLNKKKQQRGKMIKLKSKVLLIDLNLKMMLFLSCIAQNLLKEQLLIRVHSYLTWSISWIF